MCDTIAGELLVSFHRDDPAAADLMEGIRGGLVTHVEIIDRLAERLAVLNLPGRSKMELDFVRLRVPPGDEAYKINYLQFYYKHALLSAMSDGRLDLTRLDHRRIIGTSNFHLQVVPHSWISLAGSAGARSCTLSQVHEDYKKLLGWNAPGAGGRGKTVLVADTGYDPAQGIPVIQERNFVDSMRLMQAVDDHGHGTAVAAIIHDLCPMADLVVFKVADADGRASEWDLLAALAVDQGAAVINMSLAFGLEDRHCPHCGRESHASRSAVFENMVSEVSNSPSAPLLVAAAGNDGAGELAFPARFAEVVAVASVDSSLKLSDFSNYGTQAAGGLAHQNVFVLPGGQQSEDDPPTEFVATATSGDTWWGTSFASAYASGLIAAVWAKSSNSHLDRTGILTLVRSTADRTLPDYDPVTYGNGLMKF